MRGKNELNKKEVLNLYIKGLTAKEIALILKVKHDAVRQCINRNFKNITIEQQKKRVKCIEQKRELDKVLSKEAKRMMSDRNFIINNRSIYKCNRVGNLALKEEYEINCAIPYDVPKKFIVKKF